MKKKLTILLFMVAGTMFAQCFEKVSASGFHFMAIAQDGKLWGWGENNFGQLGDGTTVDKTLPTLVSSTSNWSSVSAGERHTMAIKTDGTLWGWGNDNYQGLGNGDNNDSYFPIQIGVDNDWKQVSAGERATAAIKTNGSLWIWGTNTGGYLGNGATDDFSISVPIQLGTQTDWQMVSGNGRHCLAIKTDGTLWAWGLNGDGQLGNQITVNSYTPVQIGSANDWKWIDASSRVSLALKTNNSLWGWGYLAGISFQFTSPQQIGTETDWKTISVKKQAQSQYLLMTKSNGTLWAWGNDANEQLGNGSVAGDYEIPSQVGLENDWADATAGYWQSSGIKTNGSFWVWGDTEMVENTGSGSFIDTPTLYACTSLGLAGSSIRESLIFPNPVSDYLYFNFTDKPSFATVIDFSGRTFQATLKNDKLDLVGFKDGIYIVIFQFGDKIISKKIIKQ